MLSAQALDLRFQTTSPGFALDGLPKPPVPVRVNDLSGLETLMGLSKLRPALFELKLG